MKKQFKNFGFLIAGIIIATLIFNPSFASQIRSNLVKGFVAITSDSSKAQNNLVGLDAGGKLPTDILPASAASGESKAGGWCQTTMVIKNRLNTVHTNCGEGYTSNVMRVHSRNHPGGFGTPSGSVQGTSSSRNGEGERYTVSICCMPK